MTLIQNWIKDLSDRGVKLWVQGDRLRYSGSEDILTSQLLAELSKHKAEIIALLNQSLADDDRSKSSKIQAVSRDRNLPLSFSQQRLWFLNELEGGQSITYNWPAPAISFIGELNLQILIRVLSEIVRRHEVLRTTFVNLNGEIAQKIHPPTLLEVPIIDLESIPQQDQSITVKKLAEEERAKPFDLQKGPVFHCQLLRLSKTEQVLLLSVHHIAADGWFMGIFLREMIKLYEAFIESKPSPLPELPIQYADFAAWQRNWFEGEVLQKNLNYWKHQLANIPPLLELPTDSPRPAIQTFRGDKVSFQLSLQSTQQIKQLSQRNGATLFMALLAAFAVLLSRYCQESDLVIGSPIANRDRSEIENLLGFFVNNLVLRIQVEQNQSFQDLLAQVKKIALDAYDHQNLPFEKLVEELQPERNLSYHPLFQVMFILQNSPIDLIQGANHLQMANVQFSCLEVENSTTQLDLTLEMSEFGNRLGGRIEYNTDLFERSTIERMVEHFQNLLEAITINPEQKIYNLPLLTQLESKQILIDWNDTTVNYPQDICLHELVEAQVAQTPDAIAVAYEDQQLSYQELNQKANQLAHYLRKQGIKPDQPVGISVERSLEMVIGLLGILKAGGAYVPIDPTYPKDRLAFMFADSQVSVLLTQQKLLAQLPEHTSHTLCLDSEWTLVTDESDRNLPRLSKADHLCYIIYTSGSTGKPKGAMNNHRGVVNRLLWMQSAYQIGTSDCVLQKTPFSFDVSVWEFFWTLSTGAKLVVAKPEGHKDTSYLKQLIIQAGITTLHFVPSMLQVFLDAETDLSKCSSLKRVICSGEALPIDLQRRFFERLDCELHNLYGPTEAAIDVSYWQCQANSHLSTVPIGKPVANTQLYVLDNYLQPVPIGVAGELHIGGVQVGRGYLNRHELTAEKFIRDPFSSDPAARLYKTGDRVRYSIDGSIEYLGRIDFQVKLRGFRIELGEIEAVLAQYSEINQAVVIVDHHQSSDRLVAYLACKVGSKVSIPDLRRFLKENLPEYMVPSAFVVLDSFPLTQSGKIDRRALPKPNQSQTPQDINNTNYPQDELELRIAQIWQRLLGIKSLSTHDNFFELGGHSLLAIRLSAQLEELVGHPVPIMSIFQSPTIADLAKLLRQGWTPSWNHLVPLKPDGTNPPFFCIHEGFGEVFVYRNLVKHLDAEQPFYGLQAQGLDGKHPPLKRIDQMAANYLTEIRSLQPTGPYYLGGFCAGGVVAYEMAQQLHRQGQEVALIVLMDTGFQNDILVPAKEFWEMRWRNFLKISLLEKIKRTAQKPKKYLETIQDIFKLLQCRFYLKINYQLPPDLRKFYLYYNNMVAHVEAIDHYRPQPISYPVTLINTTVFDKTRLSDYKQLWSQLALNQIDYHIIEGVHNLVFEEPEVQQIALKLQACLDKSLSDNCKDILKNEQESK
jgi:amino acid adenylation domain-containing protein